MQHFLQSFFGSPSFTLQALPKAGSDRAYYRVHFEGQSYIVCASNHIRENECFLYFTEFFHHRHIPVPQIIHIDTSKTMYIVEDVGNTSLLDIVLQEGHTENVKTLYKKSLQQVVNMQTVAGSALDYTRCVGAKQFDDKAVLADLNYFKYYFLDVQQVIYNKADLQEEWKLLSETIGGSNPLTFMYRDFQGRNIFIQKNEPYFIDYQGGMQGPPQYDVASLLWQAKAALPVEWKHELYSYYKQSLGEKINIHHAEFDQQYIRIVLVRLLQVMGAYGLRGWIEKRPHFLSSIAFGLESIKQWLLQYSLQEYPVLMHVLHQITQQDFMQKCTIPLPMQQEKTLNIRVQSFSYKKGIPPDESGNGGGFVFDCRGILNPGRFDAYKPLTGRDKEVIDFLESKTNVHTFLHHAKQMVDINVSDYLKRGFDHLMISFGCTGGQHRSVFCADQMANYLREKQGVHVTIRHIEQEAKNWVNG